MYATFIHGYYENFSWPTFLQNMLLFERKIRPDGDVSVFLSPVKPCVVYVSPIKC